MVARRYLMPGQGEGFIFLVAGISLVAVALRKRPEDRFQDGDQLARALRAGLSGASPIDLEI